MLNFAFKLHGRMASKNKKKKLIHNKRRNKIRIHHEGVRTLTISGILLVVIAVCSLYFLESQWLAYFIIVFFAVIYGIVFNFFRCPIRMYQGAISKSVVAPADGKIVVIEEVDEDEYFHDKRKMVSIFMSLVNVHANWIPCEGVITKVEHHNGNFKAAYLPKASTENERSTIVIRTSSGEDILVRQIAGAMARRIVTYAEPGTECYIDDHLGFIKFGSRVDVYLPLDAEVLVSMGQTTVGDETLIARLK